MFALLSLFSTRQPMRSFALLDAQGICRALRQSTQAPQGPGWIELQQCCPSLLNRPLPASARRTQNTPCQQRQLRLAA